MPTTGSTKSFNFWLKINVLSSSTLTENTLFLEGMYLNDRELLNLRIYNFQCHLSSERILVKPDSVSLKSLSSFLRKQSLQNVYPNLDKFFDCLKRVKNYLRSTLSQEKLNALAILCIFKTNEQDKWWLCE